MGLFQLSGEIYPILNCLTNLALAILPHMIRLDLPRLARYHKNAEVGYICNEVRGYISRMRTMQPTLNIRYNHMLIINHYAINLRH